MKLAGLAVLVAVLAALLAGCGGGVTTTVIERTVTEKVPVEGHKKAAADTEKSSESSEPQRTIHLQSFRSPSGNIGCVMSEGGARCDIRKRNWAPPARPASCAKQVDFGQGLTVSGSGQARFVCAGDTALQPGAAALAYGTASEIGGAECISRSGGITCVNRSGHGFFLSVQSYQVF